VREAIEIVFARPFHIIHRNADRALKVMLPDNWRFSMTSRPSEAAIDEIVASCNGDLHGALKALLLVNEQLEAELLQLYAAVALGGPFERGSNALH
jgi:hypothetical protein